MAVRPSQRVRIRRVSPKLRLGERARIGVAAQLALAHPRGVASGRKKEEGIPPAEAAHHDVSVSHPEAARKADSLELEPDMILVYGVVDAVPLGTRMPTTMGSR